jgi:hypothetical protein
VVVPGAGENGGVAKEVFSWTGIIAGREYGKLGVLKVELFRSLNAHCTGAYSPRIQQICFYFLQSGSVDRVGVPGEFNCRVSSGTAWVTLGVDETNYDAYADDEAQIQNAADLLQHTMLRVSEKYKRKTWMFDHERFIDETCSAIEEFRERKPPIELPPIEVEYNAFIDELLSLSPEELAKRLKR